MHLKSLNITLFFFLLYLISAGKDLPVKFGEVSLDELKMTRYEKDTSAAAVVLFNYGYFTASRFYFTQIIRIKILKKEGLNWANKTFPYISEANIEGVTVNLEDGQVEKTKLNSESIFKEKVIQDIQRYRVSMPNVKVGSVFDIKLTGIGIPSTWYLQDIIPVKRSELYIEKSSLISYRKHMSGFEPITINEEGHWMAENMPAFKSEPYLNNPENYITKLDFDIVYMKYYDFYAAYNSTWEHISLALEKYTLFGETLQSDAYMKPIAKEISAKANTDEKKLKLALDYIKTFKWDNTESLMASNSPLKFALNKKSGNSADINIAFIQLLTKLDFDVKPVVLSSRSNGFIIPAFPALERLNYVIALVKLNDQKILIDATEENAPYYLLPERCLNYYGQTVNSTKSELIEINSDRKEKKAVYYNMNLTDDLKLSGTLGYSKFDYAALKFRNEYKKYAGEDLFIEELLKENPQLMIKEALIEDIDSIYKPVKEKYNAVINNAVDVTGNAIMFYPMLLERTYENPFLSEKRNYPVDFAFCREETGTIIINIPENFTVTSLPESVVMKMPDNNALFIFKIVQVDKAVQVSYKFSINKALFMENEYPDLRAFYNQLVLKHAEPVTLKRN